jgi:fatty acid-binding protein DegV
MKGSMEKVVHDISRLLKHNKLWEYAITHADNPAGAEWYQTKMEQLTGKRPVFVDHASPALVANTGPGVVCVSLVLE